MTGIVSTALIINSAVWGIVHADQMEKSNRGRIQGLIEQRLTELFNRSPEKTTAAIIAFMLEMMLTNSMTAEEGIDKTTLLRLDLGSLALGFLVYHVSLMFYEVYLMFLPQTAAAATAA
jgi:hypothetical protein